MKNSHYYQRFEHFLTLDLDKVGSFRQLKTWLKDKKKILDVGCGVGYLTCYLGATGIDSNSYAIGRAKKLYPDTKFLKASADCLPFANNSFEAIVCYNVLEHLTHTQREKFFNEAHRVLKKNGLFLAGYIDETHPVSRLYPLFFPTGGRGDPTHKVSWSPEDFKKEVAKYFKIVKEKKTSPFGRFLPFSQIFKNELLLYCQAPTFSPKSNKAQFR